MAVLPRLFVRASVQLHPAWVLKCMGVRFLQMGFQLFRKKTHFQIKLGLKRSAFSQVKYQLKGGRSVGLDTKMKLGIKKIFFLAVR